MQSSKLNLLLIAAITLLLTSCSNDKKELTPTSTEFVSGEIARLIELVDEPCEFTFHEQDGAFPSQIMRLKVKLKNSSGRYSGKDPHDIDFPGIIPPAQVDVNDENGVKLVDLKLADSDLLKLKKLIVGEENSTDEFIFEYTFHNSEDSPKWFKDAVNFTPSYTGSISIDRF